MDNYIASKEDVFRTIDYLKKLGCMEILLSGGEVFLHPDILDILEYVTKTKMGIVLFTNGTLIDEILIDELKKFNIFMIGISIYGSNSSVHDSITKVQDSFNKSFRALRLLRSAGFSVTAKTTLMKSNATDVFNLIELYKKENLHFEMSPFISAGIKNDNAPIVNRLSDLEIITCAKAIGPLPPIPQDFAKVKRAKESRLCGAGSITMHIAANGDVFPCMSIHRSAGNVYVEDLISIWENSPVFKEYRNYHYSDSQCSKCEKSDICVRCPGVALEENGHFLKAPQEFCRIVNSWESAYLKHSDSQ